MLTDGTWTYTWQNGRELASMTDGTTTWNYIYDANGMRTSRTNGTKTYNYVYNGSQLTQMTVGNDTLYFTYGVLGPTTVTWNGETYYYALNGQGDVVGIFDEDGNPVVTYAWDNAWGYNPIPEGVMAATLGTLNPLRYRSYVYDSETGYYYLQSRYYDPEIGRFINVDAFASTGQGLLGNNMFAYCLNNPVVYVDPTGNVPLCQVMCAYMHDGGYVPKMITDQGAVGIGNKRFGASTVAQSGCGAVATYNTLITLGDAKTFDEVLSCYNETDDRTVLWGFLGTLPNQVANFFEDHGYRVIMTNDPGEIANFSQTADACILWYAYSKEPLFNAHFVHYHKHGRRYIAYNTGDEYGTSTFKNPYDYGNQGNRFCPIGIFIYQ